MKNHTFCFTFAHTTMCKFCCFFSIIMYLLFVVLCSDNNTKEIYEKNNQMKQKYIQHLTPVIKVNFRTLNLQLAF